MTFFLFTVTFPSCFSYTCMLIWTCKCVNEYRWMELKGKEDSVQHPPLKLMDEQETQEDVGIQGHLKQIISS